jgi:tRNA(Ile)-lysidine synthase
LRWHLYRINEKTVIPLTIMTPSSFLEGVTRTWPTAWFRGVTMVVAVSGGPDSVALLRLLAARRSLSDRVSLVVAHYQHGVRGAEAEADATFVASLAAACELPFHLGRGSPRPVAEVSEEMLREERYAFLQRVAAEVGARYVALGHTCDDQVETILFRLLRGTGVRGVTGMPQARRLSEMTTLIRPLLQVRRSELLSHLEQLGQPYRIDSSNHTLDFARNRIRHELLPRLEREYAADVRSRLLRLARTAELVMADTEARLQPLVSEAVSVQRCGCTLSLAPLRMVPARLVRELLVHLWQLQRWPRGAMSAGKWVALYEQLFGPDRVQMYPGGVCAKKQGEELLLTRPAR